MDDLLPGMLHLARGDAATLTRQLTDQLRLLITSGRLAPGQRLPSSRHLAQSLEVSRNTVSFAIEQLVGRLCERVGRPPCGSVGRPVARWRQTAVEEPSRRCQPGEPFAMGAEPATHEMAADP